MSEQLLLDVLRFAQDSVALARALESQAKAGDRRKNRHVTYLLGCVRYSLGELAAECVKARGRKARR